MAIKTRKINGFRVCGFSAEADLNSAEREARALWNEKKAILLPIAQDSSVLYGIISNTGGNSYSYLLGVRAPDNSQLLSSSHAEGDIFDTISIPSGEYACAKIQEGGDSNEVWARLVERELPKEGYELDKTRVRFERFKAGIIEMWAPVTVALSPSLRALSEVKGVNVMPALKRLAGKQRVLEITAKSVGVSIAERLSDLSARLDAGELDAFRNVAHGLKGSLAQTGAEALSEEAALLETAARDGDADYCRNNLPAFAKGAEGLAEGLLEIFGD